MGLTTVQYTDFAVLTSMVPVKNSYQKVRVTVTEDAGVSIPGSAWLAEP